MKHPIAPSPLARPFLLVDRHTGFEQRFARLADLARHANRHPADQAVYNGRNRELTPLVVQSARLKRATPLRGYIRRQTPVPYVGGPKKGPSVRNVRIFRTQRLAGLVMSDEGEVAGRFTARFFEDTWDLRPRHKERSWKRQCKGRKSWDR